jgi:hypothetical protein
MNKDVGVVLFLAALFGLVGFAIWKELQAKARDEFFTRRRALSHKLDTIHLFIGNDKLPIERRSEYHDILLRMGPFDRLHNESRTRWSRALVQVKEFEARAHALEGDILRDIKPSLVQT